MKKISLAFAALLGLSSSQAGAATITGLSPSPGASAGTLVTTIVIDNGSGVTNPAIKITKDAGASLSSFDAGELKVGKSSSSFGVNYNWNAIVTPSDYKILYTINQSGAEDTLTGRLTSFGVSATFQPAIGAGVYRYAIFSNNNGSSLALRGGNGNKYTRLHTDIPYASDVGPGSIIEFNGQTGTADNQAANLPVLNGTPTFLWSGTYSQPGTPANTADFGIMSVGGAGNALNLFANPGSYAGITTAAPPAIVVNPTTKSITLGTAAITANAAGQVILKVPALGGISMGPYTAD